MFYSEAMRCAMRILLESVWISGHLRMLHDSILSFRGDLASRLFDILTNERESEALNPRIIPLQAYSTGTIYTNRLTGKKLADRIDFQIKTGSTLDLLRVIADYHNCPGDSNVANNI
jgi:hypothetical protein